MRKNRYAVLRRPTPERVSGFSDGVFAVLITVLVFNLRPPEAPTFGALLLLWPTWLSYAVSYLFIAIVWTNHHYLMRYATEANLRLLWFNFSHLFSMSLLPLSTAWMANSELAPQPVGFYAAVFFLVNATYICLISELIDGIPTDQVSLTVRKIMRVRSITTLCLFGVASVVALKYPLAGLGICICCCPLSKNEILSARVAHLARHAAQFGTIIRGPVTTDMGKVRQRKCNMVEAGIAQHIDLYQTTGGELIMGTGRFVAPKTLEVRLNDGGARVLAGDQVFLDIGTHAAIPSVPGLGAARPLTHIEALELDYLPSHLVVLGGGYVGLEMAQAYRRFGSRVTI